MYEAKRLEQAKEVVESYQFEIPLIRHLKSYFKANKKLGSKDRRHLKQLVFDYYRLGLALPAADLKTKIAVSHFLRNNSDIGFGSIIEDVFPQIKSDDYSKSISGKEKFIQEAFPEFSIENVFPNSFKLSHGTDIRQLTNSVLKGSITWVRAKKRHLNEVKADFQEHQLAPLTYKEYPLAFGFEQQIDFSEYNSFNKGYFEVQDLSSQQCVNFMNVNDEQSWWDVCSGSGGKALLVFDQVSDVHMTLSDNRRTILKNLKKRLKKADVHPDLIFELDATSTDDMNALNKQFDRIMVDVPCSGSGTWARNPEWIQTIDQTKLDAYNKNQEVILSNALKKLNKGGELYYMTCSVFECENEHIVELATRNKSYKTLSNNLITSTQNRGDNLFFSAIQRI